MNKSGNKLILNILIYKNERPIVFIFIRYLDGSYLLKSNSAEGIKTRSSCIEYGSRQCVIARRFGDSSLGTLKSLVLRTTRKFSR
jgi:hypothetical protein